MTILDTGQEVEECLPQLRYVPASGLDGPTTVLQQAWRVSVYDGKGRNMGGRIEWRYVPFEPSPR